MPIQWAGLSPELLVPLDRQSGEPLRTQLECGLREAIRSGRLQANERLPSSRELARALGVSRGLVQECYGQLQAEGYWVTRGGSARRVAASAAAGSAAPVVQTAHESGVIADFRTGVPDLASFPRLDWQWATREVCRHAPNSVLGYGPAHGSLVLREVLSAYLRRVRGADAPASRIVVCSGFAQGLQLVFKVLAAHGIKTVALEDPGVDAELLYAAASAGLAVAPVPVDVEGIVVEALESSGAQAVVVTPAHQWPTGVVMSARRRHELVRWAQERQGLFIEDDYDSEFRYDRDPVGAIQGLAPNHTVCVGTVSKSLAPGIRLAWLVCPPSLVDGVASAKMHADRGTSSLDQLIVARLMESGRYDRHLRRMRTIYRDRRNTLANALAQHGHVLTGLAAGFHAVAHLKTSSETEIISTASERGVKLYGMSLYRSDNRITPAQLVLGFGNLTERAIEAAVAVIGPLF